VIFISHKFEEIYEIADDFTVLRDGRYIGEGRVKEAQMDDIITMMVGRSLEQRYAKIEVEQGPVILQVQNLASLGEFKQISFELHRGEVLGIFGLIGSGRTELMHALFGITQPSSGSILIDGEQVHVHSPQDALAHGFAYVPEDRQQQGVILKMNIRENVTLPIVKRLSHSGFLDRSNELAVTQQSGKRLDVRAAGWEQAVESLSGGNQQKVALGKWLATRPKILILDEPTRGIDVATKVEVHKFMGELAGQGMGIIMVSSEMLEILGISDNIIVMHEGRITARFKREEATAEKVLRAAVGSGGA
jgi:rhamnose transport system ATP-binding protein